MRPVLYVLTFLWPDRGLLAYRENYATQATLREVLRAATGKSPPLREALSCSAPNGLSEPP